MIKLNTKTAHIDLVLPDGTVRALHYDPESVATYTQVVALYRKAGHYADRLAELGQEKEQQTPEQANETVFNFLDEALTIATDFEKLVLHAFGREWSDLQKEVGVIDNVEVIAAIMREMVDRLSLAKAKQEVRASEGL